MVQSQDLIFKLVCLIIEPLLKFCVIRVKRACFKAFFLLDIANSLSVF